MGYHCSWLALPAAQRLRALSTLGLEVVAQLSEPVYDTGLYGFALPSNHYLVFADGWDFMPLLEEEHAEMLSGRGEAWFFSTDDAAMTTRLAGFVGGELAWAVTYDGSNGVSRPRLEGAVPDLVSDLLQRLSAAQDEAGGDAADVDHLYELTSEAGRVLLAFRHDTTPGAGALLPVDVLARSA